MLGTIVERANLPHSDNLTRIFVFSGKRHVWHTLGRFSLPMFVYVFIRSVYGLALPTVLAVPRVLMFGYASSSVYSTTGCANSDRAHRWAAMAAHQHTRHGQALKVATSPQASPAACVLLTFLLVQVLQHVLPWLQGTKAEVLTRSWQLLRCALLQASG